MIMMEDISSEKRMKSTMSRYMDPGLAAQLMDGGEEILGGQSTEATVLFSDVASFTTLSEELGAQGIVSLLNEYFTLMVDCLNDEVACSTNSLAMPLWLSSEHRSPMKMTRTVLFAVPFK